MLIAGGHSRVLVPEISVLCIENCRKNLYEASFREATKNLLSAKVSDLQLFLCSCRVCGTCTPCSQPWNDWVEEIL